MGQSAVDFEGESDLEFDRYFLVEPSPVEAPATTRTAYKPFSIEQELSKCLEEFDPTCPYIGCEIEGPHSHMVCPKCAALRFQNPHCKKCQKVVQSLALYLGRSVGNSIEKLEV